MKDIILNERKSIAFDLDGTLISIEKRDYIVYCQILNKYKLKALEFDIYWSLRKAREPINNILKANNHLTDDFIHVYLEERSELIESKKSLAHDTILEDTKEVLQKVQSKYNCYLVTSRKNEKDTIQQVENFYLNRYFNRIIFTGQNKLLGYSQIPNLLFIVGDTENDILPASTLGVKSYAVTSGIRSYNFLKNLNPTYLHDSLESIMNYI